MDPSGWGGEGIWTGVGDEVRVIEGVGAVGSADFILHAGEAAGGFPARDTQIYPRNEPLLRLLYRVHTMVEGCRWNQETWRGL